MNTKNISLSRCLTSAVFSLLVLALTARGDDLLDAVLNASPAPAETNETPAVPAVDAPTDLANTAKRPRRNRLGHSFRKGIPAETNWPTAITSRTPRLFRFGVAAETRRQCFALNTDHHWVIRHSTCQSGVILQKSTRNGQVGIGVTGMGGSGTNHGTINNATANLKCNCSGVLSGEMSWNRSLALASATEPSMATVRILNMIRGIDVARIAAMVQRTLMIPARASLDDWG